MTNTDLSHAVLAALLKGRAHEALVQLLYEAIVLLLEAWHDIGHHRRDSTLRLDASCNFGATGRRGAAVHVEVAPSRGQPDRRTRAGERCAYSLAVSWG